MSRLPEPPKVLNPLWIIFLFFSFTEVMLGFVVFNTTGGIQIALTVFVIGFPLLVSISFFLILWNRPEHLYAPKDFISDESFLKSISGTRTSRESLKESKEVAEKVGLLAPESEAQKDSPYFFQTISDKDPQLALLGLRSEIEQRLIQLAEKHGIDTDGKGLGQMLRDLQEARVFTGIEWSVITDMVGSLNHAAHNKGIRVNVVEWALDVGPRLLKTLDAKIGS